MAQTVAELVVQISAENSDLKAKLAEASKSAEDAGSKIGKALDETSEHTKKLEESLNAGKEVLGEFGVDVNKITEFLSGGAGLALAFAFVAEKGFEAAKEFDEVGANLGKMTGDTGAALDGLKTSLANVSASGMVQGIDDVGKALAELHIRLGLSGDDLEKAVSQFGEFAEITGQPVAAAVTDVTKLMAQWKIPADDLELTLDKLTKTTQLTGVSAADLTKNVADSGPIFKAAGFSINEVLGLMTGFQKAGIDASSATQGINIALRKFAAEGVTDSKGALQALINEIATTPDKARAATLAVENFGRSGITMGQAIRDGALDVGKWTDAIAEAEGTLKKTGDATQSLDDVSKKLGNQIQGLLAESFKSVLEIIKPFIVLLSDSIKAFESLPGPVKSTVEAVALLAGGLSTVRVAMVAFGLSVDAALGPIGLAIGAITLITMGVFAAANAQKEYNAALEKQADENAKHAESAQKIVGSITELNRNQKINQDQVNELIRIYPELTGVIKANDSTLGDSATAAALAADAHTKLTAQLQLEQVIAQKKTVYVDLDEMHRQFNELNASRKQALAQGDTDAAKSYAVELAGVKADYDAKKVVLSQLDADQKKYQTQVNFGNQQFVDGHKKANAEVVASGNSTFEILTAAEKKAAEDRKKLLDDQQKASDATNDAILASDLKTGEERAKLIEKITTDFIANSDERIKYFDIETDRQINAAKQLGIGEELQAVLEKTRLIERAKLVDELAKKEAQSWNEAMSGVTQTMSSALPQLSGIFGTTEKLLGQVFTAIKKGVGDTQKFVGDLAKNVGGVVQSILGAIDQGITQSSAREIAAIDQTIAADKAATAEAQKLADTQLANKEAAIDAETNALLVAAGVQVQTTLQKDQAAIDSAIKAGDAIAQKQAEDQLKYDTIIDQQTTKKTGAESAAALATQQRADAEAASETALTKRKAELAYQSAHTSWELQIAESIAGAALAIIQCYSSLGPIGGTIAAVLVGAVTGIEIGVLASNEPKPSAYAVGTNFSNAGPAMLAEQGPELVMQPGVHNLAKGSKVLTASQTAQAMGGGGGNNTFNFYSPTTMDAGAQRRAFEQTQRHMAFRMA